MAGYHKTEIPRGVYGDSTKILEEVQELIDAERQGIKVMQIAELSDIVGAIDGYLRNHFPSFTVRDLELMAAATRSAFETGHRK